MKSMILGLSLVCAIFSLQSLAADSETKVNMNFRNEEVLKVIEVYSKASGQKFIVDPVVRGKISILNPGAVSLDEAFNQLSSALALNGFAMSRQGDLLIVKTSRNIQRDLIEVSSTLPALQPERFFTWVYETKSMKPDEVMRDLRNLSSKDGEMLAVPGTRQVIFTDWMSNLHRIKDLLAAIDKLPSKEKATKK